MSLVELLRCIFFSGYLRTGMGTFPRPLSPSREKECITRMLEGDEKAKDTLIEHNLRLVAHIAKKYSQAGEQDDIISIGTIGLIKGVNSFNPEKNVQLATYISRCVENAIHTLKKLSTINSKSRQSCGCNYYLQTEDKLWR